MAAARGAFAGAAPRAAIRAARVRPRRQFDETGRSRCGWSTNGDADAPEAGVAASCWPATARASSRSRTSLGRAARSRCTGSRIPPEHTVWVAGRAVPVDAEGNFVVEEILPRGRAHRRGGGARRAGNGELFLRDLEFKRNDWFYVGIADVTLSRDKTRTARRAAAPTTHPLRPDSSASTAGSRSTHGKFGDGWGLTASADTREGPVDDLFSNFLDKSPGRAVPAHRPRLLLPDLRRRRHGRGDGADARASSTSS
jgi:hypothetical protein